LSDIACFIANWDDKATNLARIAAQLNIGLNSLVFVDDNPAERSIVRRLQPEVAVPELPDDPAGYIMALDRHCYFQALTVSAEDLKRTDYYRTDLERKTAESSAADLDGFLQSLEMTARIGPITRDTLERSVQLIHRSNQFNLTTRRHSAAEVQSVMEDVKWLTRTVSLADKFGDNGLISVLLARIDRDALVIDTWLMSCRVLKRGVEQFLLNHVAKSARDHGLTTIRGEYIPTPKNGLVRDHYPNLGFTHTSTGDGPGHTQWELRLDNGWSPKPTYITECRHHGIDSH
jgi:FkbH-like protein